MTWQEYLKDIYFTPKHPASFGGPQKLYEYVKKEDKHDIGLNRIRQWLQSQEAYSLHRPVRRTFPTNRVLVEGIDDQWDADLMDMSSYADKNNGVKYVLLVIDIFSKYIWLRPLYSKTGREVQEAFASIKRTPKLLRTDKGKEFTNHTIENYFKSRGIHHFVTQNQGKANFAERGIKTIKSHIQRYMTHHQTHEYIKILPDVNQSYNTSYHTTIGMSPKEVSKENERAVWWLTYWPKKRVKKKPFKFKVDAHVRIPYLTNVFTREYDEKWTGEVFIVTKRYRRDGINVYTVKDLQNEPIKGTFYEQELSKTALGEIHKIEEVLKERKRQGKKEYFVKWKYYPKKFNSWISHDQLHSP